MIHTITVTCTQDFGPNDVVTSTSSVSGPEAGLDNWRQAITAAAIGAGFSIDVLNRMIVDWADEVGGGGDD